MIKRIELLLLQPRLRLSMKNTYFRSVSLSGCDIHQMICFLSELGITYKKWWSNGTPRMAELSLGFTEVVQHPTEGIRFIGRTDVYA
jgi:hypothetical protein